VNKDVYKFNTCSIVSNAYLSSVSFASLAIGLGLQGAGLGLALGSRTAGLDIMALVRSRK